MVFACQADSFLVEFSSKVVSCEEAELKVVSNGKKTTVKGYEVVLEDTILFPEGGGQPCDTGSLDGVPVLQVTRRGAQAVHFVAAPLAVGAAVRQRLDWGRRLDHMQQHSGQHLISAIAEIEFGYATSSWWLGEEVSYIELDTQSVKKEEMDRMEEIVNEKIRAATPVTVKVFEEGDPQLTADRARGLPEDHVGPVRVVTIQGVESNMCCGTHVSNLSQLQAIKLLHAEKGKKNKTNLHFLAGGRVLGALDRCLGRERQLTGVLKGGPSEHVLLADKLQKTLKMCNKNLQTVLKDLAVLEAEKLKRLNPSPKFYMLHRREADSDFMSIFINEVGNQSALLFLTVGDDKGAGQMVLHGEPSAVSALGPRICSVLGGRGAGKGPKFQAKVSNLGNRSEAEELIRKFFEETRDQ
ncbi:alanyl-tRNA editing protein Aarsd1-B isoform X1 [Bacillus rossius redtenbacheri]|uniref:alanyl-tRNA editing protein Aarsd1-B isoform X1 n=1 Tax=Bacillus rossius redtenbacheri TaxID=93214 RepID=UPI002FDDE952